MKEALLRDHLRKLLEWSEAHVTFGEAVRGVPVALRGVAPAGFDHTLWQLLEHVRIAQSDIVEYLRGDAYQPLEWPGDYWPAEATPPDAEAWESSVRRVLEDRAILQSLAIDPGIDLTAPLPHGTDHTVLRGLLLAADHTAYHVGQMVALRRELGIWGG
jgi:uncharacterized damage-inducible protein DinB